MFLQGIASALHLRYEAIQYIIRLAKQANDKLNELGGTSNWISIGRLSKHVRNDTKESAYYRQRLNLQGLSAC